MKDSWIKLAQFFKADWKYLVMVIIIFVMLLFSILLKLFLPQSSEPSSDTTIQSAEQVMEANSQDPAYVKARLDHDPLLNWAVIVFTGAALLSLAVGIYLDVGFVMAMRRKESWLPKIHGIQEVNWGFLEILKAIILFVFSGICIELVFLAISKLMPGFFSPNFFLVIHTTLVDLAMVGFIIHLLNKAQGSARLALGFKPFQNWIQEISFGLSTYLAVLPVFFLCLLILMAITSIIGYEPSAHPLVGVFIEEDQKAPWIIGYSLFLACVVGPIVEEVFFRGFLYPVLRKKWGVAQSMVVTALLFALTHENTFAFIPIFVLGIALTYLYEKRGSLISCMTLHIFHNSIFISYFFLMKRIFLDGTAHA